MSFNGFSGIGGVIVLILDLYALLNVFQSRDENLKKAVWAALIIVLPVFGVILWYFLGPRGKA